MLTRLGLLFPDAGHAVPLRDWSAAVILDAILTEDETLRRRMLSQLLAVDAALVIWTLAFHQRIASWSDMIIDHLAGWLAHQIPELISAQHRCLLMADELAADHCAAQLAAVRTARLARDLAAENNPSQKEISYVCGLLWTANDWICDVREGRLLPAGEPAVEVLPDWLRLAFHLVSSATSPAFAFLLNVRDAALSRSSLQTGDPLPASSSPDHSSDSVSRFERRLWETEFPLIQSLFVKVLLQHRELNEIRQTFHKSLEREKLDAMKELAYGASHEINNPLTNIATRAQTLIRDEADPERRRQLATISSQAFRAHEMIADMMLFAKPPQCQRQPLDLAAFLPGKIDSFQADLDLKPATIELSIEDPALTTMADPVQLDVALRAVLKNGIEASAGQRRIAVLARRSPGHNGPISASMPQSMVEIEVRDAGRGLSPEARRHIFDPFYSGREAGRGHGFGLSKAWRIVEQHGGDIVVTSELGVGTSFFIRLPAMDPQQVGIEGSTPSNRAVPLHDSPAAQP
jgi:signal transduction histidine kinase